MSVLMLLGLLALPAVHVPTESAAEQLRVVLREALAAPDARARKKAAAGAKALARELSREDFVAALRAGPLLEGSALEARDGEELSEHDGTRVGYTFESGGATYRYALHLPRKYAPGKAHALLLDPGHGSAKGGSDATRADMLGMYRRHAIAAGLTDWIVARTEIVEAIGAGGERGELPDDEVAQVFLDFLRALSSRVQLDPDRIYVAGLSQTGYWSWYLGRFRSDRFAGINPMSAISRVPADAYLPNFLNLPTFVMHGDADPTCSVDDPRVTCARLELYGAPVQYREFAGGEHDYSVWGKQPAALEWLAERPREQYPKRIAKSLQTELDGWCHWIRVDELAREGNGQAGHAPTGGVDAEIEGQTVRIYSEGVEHLTLCLAPEMLDLDQPVEVIWNGERAHSGAVERDLVRSLEVAAEKGDWTASFEAFLELKR